MSHLFQREKVKSSFPVNKEKRKNYMDAIYVKTTLGGLNNPRKKKKRGIAMKFFNYFRNKQKRFYVSYSWTLASSKREEPKEMKGWFMTKNKLPPNARASGALFLLLFFSLSILNSIMGFFKLTEYHISEMMIWFSLGGRFFFSFLISEYIENFVCDRTDKSLQ